MALIIDAESSIIGALLATTLLLLIIPGQCSAVNDNDILFQVSTIDALTQGVFDGYYSFDDLRAHGDFGIGTFDALEGEMAACRIETMG